METFFHHSRLLRCRNPQGAAPCGQTVAITAVGGESLRSAAVWLRLWQEGVGETLLPMERRGDTLHAAVSLPDRPCLIWYFFVIRKPDGQPLYYGGSSGEGGFYAHEPPAWRITVYDGAFTTPAWFRHALVYQIFPDRFRRSSWEDFHARAEAHRSRGRTLRLHDRWLEPPAWQPEPGEKDYVPDDYFGGDLNGIREKLP